MTQAFRISSRVLNAALACRVVPTSDSCSSLCTSSSSPSSFLLVPSLFLFCLSHLVSYLSSTLMLLAFSMSYSLVCRALLSLLQPHVLPVLEDVSPCHCVLTCLNHVSEVKWMCFTYSINMECRLSTFKMPTSLGHNGMSLLIQLEHGHCSYTCLLCVV